MDKKIPSQIWVIDKPLNVTQDRETGPNYNKINLPENKYHNLSTFIFYKLSFYHIKMFSNIIYYYPPPTPKVWHSINSPNLKYFKEKNQESVQELQDQYWKFQIPKFSRNRCNNLQEVMNTANTALCSKLEMPRKAI